MSREENITSEYPTVQMATVGPLLLTLRHSVKTDVGLLRDHNEDDYVALPEHGVYLVADGMGGHNAGAVASQICVDTVASYLDNPPEGRQESEEDLLGPDPTLAEALRAANRAIYDAAIGNKAFEGMGTTAVGVRLVDNALTVTHAGDSRAYLFRNGDLRLLTEDHSLSNYLRLMGREGEARFAEATMGNVIMRALGLEPTVEVDASLVTVEPRDRLLLCSDGLSDLVTEDEIIAVLMNPEFSRQDAVDQLIELALDEGGRDNITVMLVDVYESGTEPDETDDVPEESDPHAVDERAQTQDLSSAVETLRVDTPEDS